MIQAPIVKDIKRLHHVSMNNSSFTTRRITTTAVETIIVLRLEVLLKLQPNYDDSVMLLVLIRLNKSSLDKDMIEHLRAGLIANFATSFILCLIPWKTWLF